MFKYSRFSHQFEIERGYQSMQQEMQNQEFNIKQDPYNYMLLRVVQPLEALYHPGNLL